MTGPERVDDGVGGSAGLPTSDQFRAATTAEWARGLNHPLVLATAGDTIGDAEFARWIGINANFLRTYRRFLMVMGTLTADERAARLMFHGVQATDEELRWYDRFAEGFEVDLHAAPSARSLDFSSYCMASVGQGWGRGLVVAFALESLYYDAWRNARDQRVPSARFAEFIDMWSSDYQREFVAGLRALVDKVTPTAELERVFRTTVRLELASWDEACGIEAPDQE